MKKVLRSQEEPQACATFWKIRRARSLKQAASEYTVRNEKIGAI